MSIYRDRGLTGSLLSCDSRLYSQIHLKGRQLYIGFGLQASLSQKLQISPVTASRASVKRHQAREVGLHVIGCGRQTGLGLRAHAECL